MGDNADYITNLINHFSAKHKQHYETALKEIIEGKKKGHWIWYLIPTPPYIDNIDNGEEKGSDKNKKYALRDNAGDINGEQAAKAYLDYNKDGVNLGENYYNLLNAINKKINNYESAEVLLESDVAKLQSSVTLFKKITDGKNEDLYKKINKVCSDIINKLQSPNKDVVRVGDEDGETVGEEDGETAGDEGGEKVRAGDEEVKCFFKLINNKATSGEEYKIFVKNTEGNDNEFSTILEKNGFNYIIYSNSNNNVLIINVKTEYSLQNILGNIHHICDDIIIISKKKDMDNINLIFIYNIRVLSIIETLKDTTSTIQIPIEYNEYNVIKEEIISQEQVVVEDKDKDKAIETVINNYSAKKEADISDKYFNLIWEKNSCYMHSLFVSLFHFNNKYIYDMIRTNDTNTIEDNQTNILSDLIKKLKIIYEKINGLNNKGTNNYTCVDFRKILQNFHNSKIHNKNKQDTLKAELDKLKAELDTLKAELNDKKKEEVRNKKKEYNDEVEKWTGVFEDPSVLYSELSNILGFDKIASCTISSTGKITIGNGSIDIVDSNDKKLLINTKNINTVINNDTQKINYIDKGKVLIIFIDQTHRNSIIYDDTIIVNSLTLKLRSIIFNTGTNTNEGHYFAVIKEGERIYKYDDIKKEDDGIAPNTTNLITREEEQNLQDTNKITGLIYSADTVCSSLDASMFYIRPYGVLGKQLTKKKDGETEAVEIENAGYPMADSYAFCDPAGLKYIKDKTDVNDAGGASNAIYKWLNIKNKGSDIKNINNSFDKNVKTGITKETDAKYAEYTIQPNEKVKCIHIVGPDFNKENDPENMITQYDDTNEDIKDAIKMLSTAYYNVLIEFILTEAPALRLLPISGDIFAGKFKRIMPLITYDSLNTACAKILSINNKYATYLCKKELNMCIYEEEDYNEYEKIWYDNIS